MRGLLSLLAFAFLSLPLRAEDPSFVVHILGYIRKDYGGAVEKGEVKSKFEYQEQIDFAKAAKDAAKQNTKLGKDDQVLRGLDQLLNGILAKADSEKIAAEALALENRVIQVAGLEVAPLRWPDRNHGRKLYKENCTQCHGVNGHGDGPAGKGLEPPASDFFAQGMSDSTPYQLFNTIRLGVPGTGMAAFNHFSDKEIWDLAFYLISLRYENDSTVGDVPSLPLAEVANSTDNQLSQKLSTGMVSRLRLHSLPTEGASSSLKVARAQLDEVLSSIRRGDRAAAKHAAVIAYLEGVEPIEPKLRAKDNDLTLLIEEKMTNLRAAIEAGLSEGAVENRVEEVRTVLSQVEVVLAKPDFTPAVTFWVAMGIFTREAFEAVLVIITLLGVIRSIGSTQAALYVHGGWALALVLGLVGWFLSGWVLQISGAQREILEGSIAFLAVAVLLYFGFWLHRKTEIGKWRAFLDEMVKSAVNGRNLIALGLVSFMAVFREAFETILFLRALVLETGPSHHVAVLGGVVVAFLIVIFLSTVLVRYSVRLPLRQLFSISSAILLLLSFILIGKGVHSFQETGLIGMTPFALPFRVEILGIYPTYESWIPQLLLVAVSVVVWGYGRLKNIRPPAATVS